jgi:hypothetical protein
MISKPIQSIYRCVLLKALKERCVLSDKLDEKKRLIWTFDLGQGYMIFLYPIKEQRVNKKATGR